MYFPHWERSAGRYFPAEKPASQPPGRLELRWKDVRGKTESTWKAFKRKDSIETERAWD